MGRGLGCLLVLAVIAWLGLEVIAWLLLSRLLNHLFETSIGSGGYLLTIGWMVLSLVVGIKLARYHISRVMGGLMNGTAGRHVLGAAGAILLALPGFISDVPGLLLLLPPVQTMLSRMGAAILASVVKRSMGKLFGGGFPGAQLGAGSSGPFPGMKPMTPDDRARFGKPGKTYDATVEKDDK